MNGYYGANYESRFNDLPTTLLALGKLWERCHSDSAAQDAANLYYRLKGQFVTERYHRKG